MSATRFAQSCGVVLCLLLAFASGARSSESAGKSKMTPPEDAIVAAVDGYVAAYNRHDAAALAATWTENGIYEDAQSGECLTGRERIRRDLSSLLTRRDDLELRVRLDRIRFIRPDVAQVNGLAVTASRGESPHESQFRALLVREDGRWLIDNVTESLLPTAAGTYDRLRELEFLVGDWVDDRADARTTTTGRWSANRSFLVRSYTFQRGDGSTHEGTQIIGWGVS